MTTTENLAANVNGLDQDWSFYHTPWEVEFLSRFSQRPKVIRIACPFIKLRNIKLILANLHSQPNTPVSIQVVTRLNLRDCRVRVHDLSAIGLLLQNPLPDKCSIRVRIDNTLHAKCFIFDNDELIITSSNLSLAGFHRNVEMALATKRKPIIDAAIEYFDQVFSNAKNADNDMVEAMRLKLGLSATCISEDWPESDESISPDKNIESPDSQLAEMDIDLDAFNKIEASLSEKRRSDVIESCIAVSTIEDDASVSSREQCAREFVRDMSIRFNRVFGEPHISESDVTAIFVHSSAYDDILDEQTKPDYAAKLAGMGVKAYETIVANIVYLSAGSSTAGGELNEKLSYITSSDHLAEQLESWGLCRVFLAPDTASSGNRTINRAAKEMAHRLVGHLVLTRPWQECLLLISNVLDLENTFPYASYSTFNYKDSLRRIIQYLDGDQPEYRVASEEGPDHDKVFHIDVYHRRNVLGSGTGPTKKIAEWKAAHQAMKNLDDSTDFKGGRGTVPLSNSIISYCEKYGSEIIKKMTGYQLTSSLLPVVLLPVGSPRCEHAGRRELLNIVGGRCRDLIAILQYFDACETLSHMTQCLNRVNHNASVARIISTTPLQKWIDWISENHTFRMAKEKRSVKDTINACFGAILIEGGLDACQPLGSILFRESSSESVVNVKSQLLDIIGQKLHIQTQEVLEFRMASLHSRSESNNPVFRVKAIFCGKEIGTGDGGTKKAAEGIACKMALDNPLFEELLNQEAERRQKELGPEESDKTGKT